MLTVKLLIESLLSFLYPPCCLHCRAQMDALRVPLCSNCLEHVALLDVEHRCPLCFSPSEGNAHCMRCRRKKVLYKRAAAACEAQQAAATLLRLFRGGEAPELAEALGALMGMQWLKMGWPPPDCVIPTATAWGQRLWRGYDPAHLLAGHIAQMLEQPLVKQPKRAFEKRILLVTHTLSSENEELEKSARLLRDACALEVYVLAFAKREDYTETT